MIKQLTMVVVLLTIPFLLPAQTSEVFSTSEGAIKGYDPVAFFNEGKPIEGKKELSYDWNHANWHFANQKNLETFKADPLKYAPQYGGYCAYGTAHGHKAPTETSTWTIVDGKLYFNYNNDVKGKWLNDQKALIEKADKNWPEVKKE
jgi:YHS domain-containing protein